MTEKRFKHKWNKLGMQFICYDDKAELLGTFADDIGVTNIVELLNELHEENEQLKQKNKGLQSELHIFKEDVTHSNKIIDKLNDENEQLQKKVESKQRVINAYEQYINDLKEDGVIE